MQSKEIGVVIKTHQIICHAVNGSAAEVNQWNKSMKKTKTNGCGHESKEYGKGKKGKGYVEIEIKMSRAPKKKGKRK